jgi:hypothetical protein
MSMFLLSGHARATDLVLRAEIEREMAELLRLRVDLVALEYEDYRDGPEAGEFPSRVSTRILDEEKVLGDRYAGYRWELELREVIGAGAGGTVEIEGGETHELLFPAEGVSGADETGQEEIVQADQVDRMLFIRVTVYPPGYEEIGYVQDGEERSPIRPRSAWTAITLPPDEDETGGTVR